MYSGLGACVLPAAGYLAGSGGNGTTPELPVQNPSMSGQVVNSEVENRGQFKC